MIFFMVKKIDFFKLNFNLFDFHFCVTLEYFIITNSFMSILEINCAKVIGSFDIYYKKHGFFLYFFENNLSS